MSAIDAAKAKIERARTATRACRWPGCCVSVPASLYACGRHWFSLPIDLRNAIRFARDVASYRAAHEAAQEWIKREHTDRSKP